jgi:large subunit ribosomal protein L10
MPTEAKRETVAELTEEARGSTTMIVSEYRGLRVSELGEIRKSLRKQNVTYHVVKNRLMKIRPLPPRQSSTQCGLTAW